MEFETLDRDDVLEIMSGAWDIEKKRGRLKTAQDLHRKTSPPPPEKVSDTGFNPPLGDQPTPQQI